MLNLTAESLAFFRQHEPMRAEALAEAEALYTLAHVTCGVSIEWQDDSEAWANWNALLSAGEVGHDETPTAIECATLVQSACQWERFELAHRAAIVDGRAHYRRIIRAEMAQEAAADLRKLLEA